MAAVRSGLFPYSCDICQADPSLREALGCDSPTQQPVWEYEGDRFFNCPYKFIPSNVYDWIDEYTYITTFPQTHTDTFEEVSAKWWEAYLLYSRKMSDCEHEKHQREMKSLPGMKHG